MSRQLTHLMSTVLTAKVRACTTTKPSHSVGLPQEPMTSRDQKTKQGRSEHYNETQSQAQHSTPAEVQHYSASHCETCKVAGCAPPFLGPLCSKLQLFCHAVHKSYQNFAFMCFFFRCCSIIIVLLKDLQVKVLRVKCLRVKTSNVANKPTKNTLPNAFVRLASGAPHLL